jgi:hypothetical protein
VSDIYRDVTPHKRALDLALTEIENERARKDEIAKLVEQTLEGLIEEALVVGDTGRMEFDPAGAREVITKALTSYEEERIPPSAIRALAEAVAINDAAGPGNDPIAMALVIRAARDLVHGVALQEGPSGEGWQQRIATIEPWRNDQQDDPYCVFCGVTRYRYDTGTQKLVACPHADDCVWQNAMDALPAFGWQPITTALELPAGTRVVVWDIDAMAIAYCIEGGWFTEDGDQMLPDPTLWYPIDPPVGQNAKDATPLASSGAKEDR